MTLLLGDSLERLKELPADSVDACVCDPPYGLSKEPDIAEVMQHWINGDRYEHKSNGFMGKSWDSFVPGPEYWREVYRVLKPGGHILVFAGTRTVDLMSVSIRFAGFEIRDMLMWLHGQGFPKSQDVSKAIDKQAGAEREVIEQRFKNGDMRGPQNWGNHDQAGKRVECNITAPATPDAKRWQGWGTALKPAFEPVVLARKPLTGADELANLALECQSKLFAEIVRVRSASSLSGETRQSIAQWLAGKSMLTPGASSEVTAMLQSASATDSSLSTELSWLSTLDGIWTHANTCTTEMESSLITDLKILKSLLSSSTQASTPQNDGHGEKFNASLVANLLSALELKLSFIHTAFAQDNATSADGLSSLHPDAEPIVVARKPLSEKTVAANVLKHGTGAINVDASRIGPPQNTKVKFASNADAKKTMGAFEEWDGSYREQTQGRWPANVLFDEYEEPVLTLQDSIPEAAKVAIEEYYAGYCKLSGLRKENGHFPESEKPQEVLQSRVLFQGSEQENAGQEALYVGQETHAKDCGQNDQNQAGTRQAVSGQEQSALQGLIYNSRLQDDLQVGVIGGGAEEIQVNVSDDEQELLCRTSACDGPKAGPTSSKRRGGASSKRSKGRQSPEQLRIALDERPQERTLASAQERTTTPLLIKESDVPQMWSRYFKDSGFTVRAGAAALLDEQSGVSKSSVRKISATEDTAIKNQVYGKGYIRQEGGVNDSGGASRFFKVIKQTEFDIVSECLVESAESRQSNSGELSAQGLAPENLQHADADKNQNKNSLAHTAECFSLSTSETRKAKKSSAQKSATQNTDLESQDQNAKSAENLAASIVTDIAQKLAAMPPDQIRAFAQCQVSMRDFKNFIQTPDLASLVANQASIDITETIRSLLRLSGSVPHVTDENTKPESPKNSNGLARFVYCAKSSKRERNAGLEGMPERECGQYQSSLDGGQMLTGSGNVRSNAKQNHHPTVKPIKLMEYLVRMITPPGGVVLDPFMGSGTTGCAAKRLGFQFVGIERESEYLEIARRRIEHAQKEITQSELPLEGA